MKTTVFGIDFEFDARAYERAIERIITENDKGYSCVVDANVLTISHKENVYREIINSASVNTCDGSSIAYFASLIHKTKYRVYTGPEIFEKFIERPYRHVVLGNTEKRFGALVDKLRARNIEPDLFHVQVPFLNVDEFDYAEIGARINEINPDMIWVSLGAPKQEKFMSLLLPHINRGVMFGIGAAISFYIGEFHHSKRNFNGLRFIWLHRLFQEPKKQINRCWQYLKCLPSLYFEELKRKRKTNINP